MQNDAKRYYDFFYLGGPNESYAFVTENEIYYEKDLETAMQFIQGRYLKNSNIV